MLHNSRMKKNLLQGALIAFLISFLSTIHSANSIDISIFKDEIIQTSKRLVFFRNNYEYALVDRSLSIIYPGEKVCDDDILDKVQIITDMLLKGPNASEKSMGIFSAFPEGTCLDYIKWDGKGGLAFYLKYPDEFLSSPVNVCGHLDPMYQQVIKSFESLSIVNRFSLMAYDEKKEIYRPLWEFAKPVEQIDSIKKIPMKTQATPQPAVYNVNRRRGTLTGKTIYVWPGHGYTISGTEWATQRPNCWNYCEDYGDIETTAFYMARYFYNAGAFVVMNRERDYNPNMVIIDNEVTSSTAGMFISNGFAPALPYPESNYEYYYYSYSSNVSYPLTGNNRPFTYGGYESTSIANHEPTATAKWIPNIPEDGYYSVYVTYGTGRYYIDNNPSTSYTTDAHYIVKHGGGVTEFRVNQQYHICTWVFLGEFYFYKGLNEERGLVILDNQSDYSVGLNVSADAVRFGGGMGNVARDSQVSGLRRWEEATKYYAQFGGAPRCIFHNDDSTEIIADNAIYYWWPDSLHQDGEDAVTILFHTNGAGGTGTETFIDPTVPNATELQDRVHTELIHDIRTGYYPSWTDRGKKVTSFKNEAPYLIVELAFHDRQYPDNHFLHDPKFRQLACRAIFQGTVKYFAQKDGKTPHLLPEPPRSPVVRNTTTGIRLNWLPPETDAVDLVGDAATSYVVYLSLNGKAWDNGRETINIEYTFTGLSNDKTYFFRITAINEGGESFPTKTLATRVAPSGVASIIIIDGHDRLDRYCQVIRTGLPSIGTINSMELPKMNSYDSIIHHAESMDKCHVYFDSADQSSVIYELVNIDDYMIVDWVMGQQGERVTDDNVIDDTFDDALREKVQNFLSQNKALFVSGTDIGFDLDSDSNQSDPKSVFFNTCLKADYVSDSTNTLLMKGVQGTIFKDIAGIALDNGDYGTYCVYSPDVLRVFNGSRSAITDNSGSMITGIQFNDDYRLVYFSFPFETIINADTRNETMNRIITFFISTNPQLQGFIYY